MVNGFSDLTLPLFGKSTATYRYHDSTLSLHETLALSCSPPGSIVSANADEGSASPLLSPADVDWSSDRSE